MENETDIIQYILEMQYMSYCLNIYNEFLEVLSYVCFCLATQMFKRLIAIRLHSFDFLLGVSYMPGDLLCRVQYLFCITVFTIRNGESINHNSLGCSK